MEYKDYYKILGVPRAATADEIKKAYRKLAREFHPDRNKSKQAEERFKEANEANEVLSDPAKRQTYDRLGTDWRTGDGFSTPPGWNFGGPPGGARGGTRAGTQTGNGAGVGAGQFGGFSDFFSTLFGSSAEAGMAGGSFSTGAGPARDQRAKITIALEDAYLGSTREISIGPRVLNVRIPKGVTTGQTIRLAGQSTGGGDLLLEVEIANHPTFRVEARDIHVSVSISPWEAALGARIPVPTLGGIVELNLPPNSQGGRKMRLKGRGLPGNPAGDEIITLGIVIPPVESDEDRSLYEQMAQKFHFDPRSVP